MVVAAVCGGSAKPETAGSAGFLIFPFRSGVAPPGFGCASPVSWSFPGTETGAALDEWRLAGDGKAGFVAVR